MSNGKERRIPWYRKTEWIAIAESYLRGLQHLPRDAKHHAELRSYHDFAMCKLVFESNTMEGAGLPEGETRNLIEQFFPHLPDTYDAFAAASKAGPQGSGLLLESVVGIDIEAYKRLSTEKLKSYLEPQVIFGERRRPVAEVRQHAFAYFIMKVVAIESKAQRFVRVAPESAPARAQKALEWLEELGLEDPAGTPVLLREKTLKTLHERISKDLLDESAKVPPGEYRQDTRMAGVQKVFMAPELVPAAMERFRAEATRRFYDPDAHPFRLAAWISHRFVEIHPFPDFNGRISRLLLAGVLLASGIPFAVSIKANKAGRKRYLEALRKADRGNLEPYVVLIARSIAESFQEIDSNLALAGLGSLRDWDPQNEASETEDRGD